MQDHRQPGLSFLEVSPEEGGMKLLRFLERRLRDAAAKAMLHRWIRTGQVRVNGGRAKPFAIVAAGDKVRVPPFALPETAAPARGEEGPGPFTEHAPLGPDLPIAAETPDLLVLVKPSGLACQPGSKQRDSVSARLMRAYAGSAYIPAPAHRLDRNTSGLLLAAKTHAAQAFLHGLFRSGGIAKTYLAWVAGDWPRKEPCLLADRLVTARDAQGKDRMAALPGGRIFPLPQTPGASLDFRSLIGNEADSALCAAAPIRKATGQDAGFAGVPAATLLLLRLFTGRKHQLRVQLASRGLPIIGDGRYQGPVFFPMLLHAYALRFPGMPKAGAERCHAYQALPAWPEALMPGAAALAEAENTLAAALRVPGKQGEAGLCAQP